MKIRMVAACALQEAGRERPLSIGSEYDDIADVVAQSLIADGRAVLVEAVVEETVDAPKGLTPPETKPVFAPENRGRRR